MFIEDLFFRLPVRDTYRETNHRAVFLRAHPTIARLCFLVEVFVCVTIFAYSYQVTSTTATTSTKISYEVVDGYDCEVLSPRSNSEAFSTKTSDMVFFSKARYNYETCMSTLSTAGLDVCSDDHRQDYLLSLKGISSSDTNCKDLILDDGYRFCYSESEDHVDVDMADLQLAFRKSNTPKSSMANIYYFTKGEGDLSPITTSFTPSNILTDFTSDLVSKVYVVAEDPDNNQRPTLYEFSYNSSTVKKLMSPSGNSFSGITYGDQAVFMYEISNQQGKIYSYNVTTKTEGTIISFSCADFGQYTPNTGPDTRYLSYGTDKNLYAICSPLTVYEKAGTPPSTPTVYKQFDYFQINPKTALSTRFGVNLNVFNYTLDGVTSDQGIDSISQVFHSKSNMYFFTTNHRNIFRGDMTQVSMVNNMPVIRKAGVSSVGESDGDYLRTGRNNNLYLAEGTHRYLDTTTRSFLTYDDLGTQSFYATYIEFGFQYQICNGVFSNYSVDYDTSSSFYSLCQQSNGIYFQSNNFFEVPSSCAGAINSTAEAYDLLTCADVKTLQQGYTSSICSESIAKVCTAEYTDNPPFSCSKDSYPSFITTIATAFANASGVWTFVVIFLKVVLKVSYPHGFNDYDYDEVTERFLPKGYKVQYPIAEAMGVVHPKDAAVHPEGDNMLSLTPYNSSPNHRTMAENEGSRQHNGDSIKQYSNDSNDVV